LKYLVKRSWAWSLEERYGKIEHITAEHLNSDGEPDVNKASTQKGGRMRKAKRRKKNVIDADSDEDDGDFTDNQSNDALASSDSDNEILTNAEV